MFFPCVSMARFVCTIVQDKMLLIQHVSFNGKNENIIRNSIKINKNKLNA